MEQINRIKACNKCYGCTACKFSCPRDAINMVQDRRGFCVPVINEKLCINCGKCLKVCQISKEKKLVHDDVRYCYGIKTDDVIRRNSSSGGVYTIISNGILAMDGNCYGAAYTDDLKVIHKKADSQKNRNQFRESKYVQSDLMSCYEEIKCDLEKKKFVLFSGTPCQVAGLKSFLEKCGTTQERLYLLDVVCHGVPSPLVFNDYLSYIEKKYKSAVVKYTFRNKNKGWKGYHPEVVLENGTTIQENEILNTYIELFKENIMLRECCYTCPYSSLKRPGDFTIGDFWGIDIIDHEYSDNKGISMLFINSDKGKKFWTQFCKNEHLTIKKYSCSVLTQHNLYKSTIPSFAKDKFWKEYHKKGYDGVVEKYTSLGDKYWLFYLKKATRIRLKKYLDN